MKLNKVLALALSGVMAVSMLAGCSGNSGNGGQNGEGEGETTVTGFAATVASKLDDNKDNVTVTSNDVIDTALKAAMVKPDDDFITGNRAEANLAVVGVSGPVYVSLEDALTDITFSKFGIFDNANSDNADEDANAAVVYYIGGDINTDRVAQLVADKIDGITLPERSDVDNDGTYYTYDYTVDVSCATATTKDGTASLNYIVVVLNQDVTKASI